MRLLLMVMVTSGLRFLLLFAVFPVFTQPLDHAFGDDGAAFPAAFDTHKLRLSAGFSPTGGNYGAIQFRAVSGIRLGVEQGVRRGKAEAGYDRPFRLFGQQLQAGASVHGQRFNFNQSREASLFAFDRDVQPVFEIHSLRYRLDGFGVAGYIQAKLKRGWTAGLRYNFDVLNVHPKSEAAVDFYIREYGYNDFFRLVPRQPESIHARRITPYVSRDTIDDPLRPTRGTAFRLSTGISREDVNLVEPAGELKHFRRIAGGRHVFGLRVQARMMIPNGGEIPQFLRYYGGGEGEIRGFDNWSVTPFVTLPGSSSVPVLNSDGSPRQRRERLPDGTTALVNVSQSIPVKRVIATGGDAKAVANFEYRIRLSELFTLALFHDMGLNRIFFRDDVGASQSQVDSLNSTFPEAGFRREPNIAAGSQRVRMSSGVEIQFLPPRLRIPLRFFAAFNPLTYRGTPDTGIADRSYFPNQASFANAFRAFGPMTLADRRFLIRFSIGRTF